MHEVDLHLHTTCSDGRLTPRELIELLACRGLKIVAITDHDTTEGIEPALEAARAFPQLTVIPGVELSTDIPGDEIHLLGYFIDYKNQEFQETLSRFREGREGRAREMVEKLNAMGVHITWDRVEEIANGASIGRPHIAQAMVEKGYVSQLQDAFVSYIGRNGPAYAEREKMTPREAVELVLKVGGLPVLAHPSWIKDLEPAVSELKDAGLVGMEVYYKEYTPQQIDELAEMARRFDLIPCGGSDYHAMGTPDEPMPGIAGPPRESVEALMALRERRGSRVSK